MARGGLIRATSLMIRAARYDGRMFESAEVGHAIDKKTFHKEEQTLRAQLLAAQSELRAQARFPVLLLISGVDGAGKSETLAQLYKWMDARYLSTLGFTAPTDEERERPHMWRYWRALPSRGRTGAFAGSWYSIPIAQRITGEMSRVQLDKRLDEINRFEAMLVNEGALLLKFWLHLTRSGQKHRLRQLESDPRTAWRVTKESWARTRTYDALQDVAGHVLRLTNTAWAPWSIVDGTDDHYRHLRVGKGVLAALEMRLAHKIARKHGFAPPVTRPADDRNALAALELDKSLPEKKYELQLAKWQGQLADLVRHKAFGRRSLVLAFEGMDAAGKGGAIRRLTAALDPRQFQVVPVAAPNEEERTHPYLWRFWRQLPRRGHVAIFDRSWYGRVLVERIEGLCSEVDWLRAYAEINDFEHELVGSGTIVLKFWLQIDRQEQLRRFKGREKIEHKRFKITADDWRNRAKWNGYQSAAVDMIDRTSTGHAPWIIVPANDKNFARVKIARSVVKHLEKALDV
jgi:polyphosphate:AMP phosphotransferase